MWNKLAIGGILLYAATLKNRPLVAIDDELEPIDPVYPDEPYIPPVEQPGLPEPYVPPIDQPELPEPYIPPSSAYDLDVSGYMDSQNNLHLTLINNSIKESGKFSFDFYVPLLKPKYGLSEYRIGVTNDVRIPAMVGIPKEATTELYKWDNAARRLVTDGYITSQYSFPSVRLTISNNNLLYTTDKAVRLKVPAEGWTIYRQ